MNTNVNAYVVGGAKGIGQWLVQKVLHGNMKVTVVDSDVRALDKLPQDVIKVAITQESSWKDIGTSIPDGAWLILATPPHTLSQIASDLLPHIDPDVLVIQTASVQSHGESAVLPHVKKPSRYLGCHPLFGPTVPTPVGQMAALTRFREEHSNHRDFREFLHKRGLITTQSTPEEHDQAMLYVQVLTHFTLLCFARGLTRTQHTFSSLTEFRTPPFHFLSAFAGRLLRSTASTVTGIQSAASADAVRELFISSANELHSALIQHKGDVSALSAWFETLREPFRGEEIDEAHSISELAVEALHRFDARLHKCLASGEACFGRHRDNGRLIVGMIEEIRQDELVLRESILPVKGRGQDMYAVAFNQVAEDNYARRGIHFPSRNRLTIKKRKLRLLEQDEVDRWLRVHCQYLTIQRNFPNPMEIHGAAIASMVPHFLAEVRSCTFHEAYMRKGEVPRVNVTLEIAPWHSIPDVCARIERFLVKAE
jgi:prephenate dehydrogenase